MKTNRIDRHSPAGLVANACARLAAVGLVAGTLLGFAPPPAHAACATVVDPIVSIRKSDSVFVGQITELSDFGRLATIRVLEIWKGPDVGGEVIVNGSFSGSATVGPSDRTFMLGSTYLVVPFGVRSPFFDEACSATGLFVPAGGVIPPRFQEAVGSTTAQIPAVAEAAVVEPDGGVSPLMWGGAGLLLVTFVLVLRRRRRNKRVAGASPAATAPTPSRTTVTRLALAEERRQQGVAAPKVDAATAVSGVSRRRKHRLRRKAPLLEGNKAKRFGRASGLTELDAMRKKTRRIKQKRSKA